MKAQEMAALLISFTAQPEHRARLYFEKTGDRFWQNVADVIRANGQNRKQRREHKQR